MSDRTNRLLHWALTIRRLMTSDGLRVHVSYDALIDEIRVEVMKEANKMEENKNDTAKVEQEKDPSKRIIKALYALEPAVNWNVSVLPKDQLAVMNQVNDAVRTGLNVRPALKAFVDLMENEQRQVTWRVLGHRANALLHEAKAAINEADPLTAAKPDPAWASLGNPLYHIRRLISALRELTSCVGAAIPKVIEGEAKSAMIHAMTEAYASMPGAETFLHSPTIPGGPQWWDRLETVAASLGALPNDDQLAAIERGVKRLQQLQSTWTRRPGDSRMLAALKSLVDVVRRGSVVNETGYSWKVLAKDLDAAMLEAGTVIAFAEEDNFHDHKKYESVPGVEGKPIDAKFAGWQEPGWSIEQKLALLEALDTMWAWGCNSHPMPARALSRLRSALDLPKSLFYP